jgi:protein phosphatase 1 regulatory subunit 10
MYNSAWLHHQSNAESSQHSQLVHEGRLQTDTWKERTTPNDQTGDSSSPSTQTTLDLSDFGLPDITAPSSSSSSIPSPPPPFFAYPGSFYLSASPPGPYNAVPYGSSWNPPSQVPLSNYSSLNGATTTMSSTQSQQQTLQPQQMMIDPSLTTINGSATNGIQQYSPPLNYSPPPVQQPQRSSFQFQQHIHPSSLSINPSYVHSPYYPSQQGTLSPHALHSPSIMSAMPPSAFSSAVPSGSQTLSPEARKLQFQTAIKPLLQASAFTGAGAVHSLVTIISDYGSQDVDAASRLDIVTKIRDGAGNHYFRAWSENATAIDISREWLKAAFTAKLDSPLVETIMPLLHVSK